MNFSINYETIEKEITEKSFDILSGKHDNILVMLENILERKFITKGNKLETYELLSYVKFKLNKPLEAYYYGYESFKKSRNSLGIVIAVMSLFKINKEVVSRFIIKYLKELKYCFETSKFNPKNFNNDYDFLKLKKILQLIAENNFKDESYSFIRNIKLYEFQDEDIMFKSYKSQSLVNMHLLKVGDEYLILDCGAQAGDGYIEQIDLENFLKGIPKEKIKGAIISHAHFDHYGSLDKLYEYTTNVYMGKQTYDLIKKFNKKYIRKDFNICENYVDFQIDNYTITPIPNGHILGSMAFYISAKGKNLFYTGDFCFNNQNTVSGLKKRDINMLMKEKGNIDYLITESTYGHKEEWLTYSQRKQLIKYFVELSYRNSVKVFIPSFAIGRAQEIQSIINEENSMYLLIDGLAKDITKYYNQFSISSNLITSKTLNYGKISVKEKYEKSPIVIASSGMLQQGSIAMEYYSEIIKNKMTTIIKSGYMDEHTYCSKFDMYDGININVIDINLSAHGQYNELIELIKLIKAENLIIVHGNGIDGLTG